MAKKSMIERDKKRMKLYNKYKYKRENLLLKWKHKKTYNNRVDVQKSLEQLPRNSAKIRIRNRCWKTGRSHGFYRNFGICRHVLREMAHQGVIPGLIKASW